MVPSICRLGRRKPRLRSAPSSLPKELILQLFPRHAIVRIPSLIWSLSSMSCRCRSGTGTSSASMKAIVAVADRHIVPRPATRYPKCK